MRGKAFAVQNAKQKAKTTKPRRKEELIHMKFTVEKRLLNEALSLIHILQVCGQRLYLLIRL